MLARYGGAFATSAALHAALAGWLALAVGLPPMRAAQPARRTEIVLLPPVEDSAFPGLKPVDRRGASTEGNLEAEGQLAGADVDRIGGHLLVLFPFVTPGLALDSFFAVRSSDTHLVFENPYVPPPARVSEQPGRRLTMSRAELQAMIDKSWTRSNRWQAFDAIRRATEDGRADDSGLATLLALYREQNALQPYADGAVRDLRLWAQLGLAADHVDFISFIRRYAAAHPSTKVATELLLLLDTIAQANEDALAVLVETDQPGDLEWTKATHPRAYLLARDITRYYAPEIARLGLTSRDAVERFYEQGRLALLARILLTTPDGYRADETRYLIGEILWKQARRDEALRTWRGLSASAADSPYTTAIAQMRAAVASAPPDARNIGYILRNQQGRWASFADDRLRRFGYRVDAY